MFTKKLLATAMICLFLLTFSAIAQKTSEKTDFKETGFKMPVINQPKFSRKTFDIRKYGAKPDGLSVNTEAIAAAIEAARRAGGGTIVFSEGIWVTGPIALASNVCLHLEKNALIVFSKNREDYPLVATTFEGVAAYRAQAPISAVGAENTGG